MGEVRASYWKGGIALGSLHQNGTFEDRQGTDECQTRVRRGSDAKGKMTPQMRRAMPARYYV